MRRTRWASKNEFESANRVDLWSSKPNFCAGIFGDFGNSYPDMVCPERDFKKIFGFIPEKGECKELIVEVK